MKWFLIIFLTVLPVTFAGTLIPSVKTEKQLPELSSNIDEVFTTEETEIATAFFDKMVIETKYNGVMLVAKYGKIVFKKAHGVKDFVTKDSMDVNTAFQLASVSKQFTSTAILVLYERGLIQLTDTIQQHIPEFPYEGITIKMLLTHRSGLPNYGYFPDEYLAPYTFMTNDDLIKTLIKHKPDIYFKPGRMYDYSNTGYAILASIVERITKKPFAEFIQSEFFTPLGMTESFVYNPTYDYSSKNIAIGHERGTAPAQPIIADGILGDKGIYSNMHDLFIWDQALYSNKIVSAESLELAFTPSISYRYTATKNYGFGWRLLQLNNNERVVYHTGWWRGFNSLFVRVLPNQTTLIFLTNRRTRAFFHAWVDFLNELHGIEYHDQMFSDTETDLEYDNLDSLQQ